MRTEPTIRIPLGVLGLFHAQPGGRAFRQVLSEGAHKPGADWSLVEQALAATQRELRPAA